MLQVKEGNPLPGRNRSNGYSLVEQEAEGLLVSINELYATYGNSFFQFMALETWPKSEKTCPWIFAGIFEIDIVVCPRIQPLRRKRQTPPGSRAALVAD